MFSLPISVTDEITGSMVPRKISIYLQTNTYFRPRLSIDSSFFRGFKLAKRHHYHEVAAYFSTGYSGLSLSKSEEMYGQIIYCYQFPQE